MCVCVCMCTVCICGHHIKQSFDQPDKVAIPFSWSAGQGKLIFSYPRSRLSIQPRETGSAVPSYVSLLVLHAQTKYSPYSRDFSCLLSVAVAIYLYRHTPSGQSRAFRVTKLRVDGVQCLEPAGTGPVVLKLVPVTGAAFASPWTNKCAPLFSHTHFWYEMDVLKVSIVVGMYVWYIKSWRLCSIEQRESLGKTG